MENRYLFLDPVDPAWDGILHELPEIEKKWKAPFYLFHEATLVRNIQLLGSCFGGKIDVAYAMKANPWLAPAAATEAEYIEVSTDGELELCRFYGIPGKKIVLDGVCRTDHTLEKALEMGVKRICIDSPGQMRQLTGIFRGEGKIEVLLRLSSGNRFGMDVEEIGQCAELGRHCGTVRIVGVQYYPGTQRSDWRKVSKELEYLAENLESLSRLPGLDLSEIQLGCGVGFPYFVGEEGNRYMVSVETIAAFVENLQKRYKVIYEAGRCVAASAGIYLTKVYQTKSRNGEEVIFCLGGTNQLQYPGGVLGIRTPYIREICGSPAGKKSAYTICGSLCNEADVLARECMLDENLQRGDLLVFSGAGAYCVSEAPNLFLAMEMPAILVYNNQDNVNLQAISCVRTHIPTYRLFDDRM